LTEPVGSLSRQLETLRTISQAAYDHGLDFILGIQWESAESPNYEVLAKALSFCRPSAAWSCAPIPSPRATPCSACFAKPAGA